MISSLGKYQFNRVPFGLAQAPAYFQKLINDVIRGCNFCHGIPQRHHNLQQKQQGTPRAPGRNLQMTKSSRTQAKAREVLFL